MPKILFICTANVARSQMAEAYYNHVTKSNDAVSAGALDFTEKYKVLPKEIVGLMQEHGIDISQQGTKLVTAQMVNDIEKIIILCEKQQCPDFLINSGKNTYWNVTDPYGMTVDETREIRDQIRAKVREIE